MAEFFKETDFFRKSAMISRSNFKELHTCNDIFQVGLVVLITEICANFVVFSDSKAA